MKKSARPANRLAAEKSPYLLQHAGNPVDWYPWGEEAFAKARREDKPVFLSIGYSSCHWCHVMAHESFEDEEVAALLNEAFVNVKVDREERPDIDHIYMTACQMLTGAGGWPLTAILTPDRTPFFAGTYYPRTSRAGRIGMMDLIPRVREMWRTRRADLVAAAGQISQALRDAARSGETGEVSAELLDEAKADMEASFDPENGGFGARPKFPVPHQLLFLLRYARRKKDYRAATMAERTLKAMRMGGIYDHVGFGFHRYSTDEHWLVPHFEKMLYDQALLAMAYLEAFQSTGEPLYARTAREIFTYVLRDMTSPEGAFCSAEDADSEGEEGKFYLWSADETVKVLGKDDGEFVSRLFGVRPEGNFAEEATGERRGANILHLAEPFEDAAEAMQIPPGEAEERWERARAVLFEARRKRVPPLKDDKILADWNGLMIAALARGAQILGDRSFLEAAGKAADFVLAKMRRPDGRLLHRWRKGEADFAGNLDDYAFLAWGLLELWGAGFDVRHLKAALGLQNELSALFGDGEGGFFFAPADAADLLVRRKELYDGAIPSGNAVAVLNLLRLGRMTGDARLEETALKAARVLSGPAGRAPSSHAFFLVAVDFLLAPPFEVVIAGDPAAADTQEMIAEFGRLYLPHAVVLLRPPDGEVLAEIAPFTAGMTPLRGRATAYVCSGFACQEPAVGIGGLRDRLREAGLLSAD
ncbi:MAG TPA: thioredoxin domain-containing protein [Syntrophales bacterium]|nr:thioredoxin domain-containing protein [Syntrophales bacterium]